jgi:hypothetical protein
MAGLALTALWMPYLWAAWPRMWLASLAAPREPKARAWWTGRPLPLPASQPRR